MLTSHDQTTEAISPACWTAVKVALIKSISKGVFFDRKYWARHSNPRGVFKPVHFSSIIMGDKVQNLNSCASKFVYRFTEVLSVASGNLPQGPKRSQDLLNVEPQRRQRL